MMRRILLSFAVLIGIAGNATAQEYKIPTFGILRGVTPSPICLMSGSTCLVSMGTMNTATGLWAIPLGSFPAIAANNLLGNPTGASAVPVGIPLGSALIFSAGSLAVDTGTSGAKVPFLNTANTWALAQTFSSPPIISLTGYLKGNGASALTAAATVPTTDLSGALQAAQEPAHTGDATNSAGSLALTLATVNANVGSFGSTTQCVSITVNAKGLITAASQAACAGTVSSVAASFTGGLISVGGSPITGAGTLALTVAGTSGGIPYFSSASTWATSAALATNGIIIGGGAGVAPSTASGCTINSGVNISCTSASIALPSMSMANSTADANSPSFQLYKSRSGGNTNANDQLGIFIFNGFANAGLQPSARLLAAQTAASSGSNIPSAFLISTSNASGQLNQTFSFDANAHIATVQATAPTVGTCGTSPTVTAGSTDLYGQITTGSTATTSCIITFGTAFGVIPFCVASPVGAANSGLFVTPALGTLTLTYTSATSVKFAYHCFGA